MTGFLIWLASAFGESLIGTFAARLLGKPVEEAKRATDEALDATRSAFHEEYGDAFGTPGNTFLDRDRNQQRLLRSTFPSEKVVVPEDMDSRGFQGAPDAPREAVVFALRAFEQALTEASSRELDRDRTLQATKRTAKQAADDSAGARAAAEQTLELMRAQDEVRGAFRTLLEQHIPPTDTLVKEGRLAEAEQLLQTRIEQTLKLVEDPGPVLKDLVNRHVAALRIMLGNVLAEAADTAEAREQFAALGDPAKLPEELRFDAARLAFNVRDIKAIENLRALLPAGTEARRHADVWAAIAVEDWEGVLVALEAFDADDGGRGRVQTRARALIELGRDFDEAARLLDIAWESAERGRARLAVAVSTADLVEGIVDGEEEAPGVDRRALVRDATNRLHSAAGDAEAPLLHAHAQLRLSTWYGFLDDRERQAAAAEAFEKIELSETDRLRFVVDPDIEEEALHRLVAEGVVDTATRDRVLALQFQAQRNTRREEAALWSAFVASPAGHMRSALAERLLDIQLDIGDEAGAEAVIDELAPEDPIRPLFAAKVDRKFRGDAAARATLYSILDARPRCRLALRSLFYLTAKQAAEAEEEERERLVEEAVSLAERLHEILPSRASRTMVAGLYADLGRIYDAVTVYEEVINDDGATVGLLRAKADLLARIDRLPEAAQTLEEAYALDSSDASLGSEAGRLWLEAAQFDRAAETLERVVADHVEEPAIHANLGFARLLSTDEERRALALKSFEEALRLAPDIEVGVFALMEAAHAANDPVAARRYAHQMSTGTRTVEVTSPEDVAEMERAVAEGGAVQGRFVGRESLRAFLEHQNRRAEVFSNLARSDMAPFGAIARRPWSARLASARRFQKHDKSRFPEAYVTRAPWPSEAMLRPLEQGDDGHPTGPSDGLLVDVTALLTLASLEAVNEVLRSAQQAYGRIVLYPGVSPISETRSAAWQGA